MKLEDIKKCLSDLNSFDKDNLIKTLWSEKYKCQDLIPELFFYVIECQHLDGTFYGLDLLEEIPKSAYKKHTQLAKDIVFKIKELYQISDPSIIDRMKKTWLKFLLLNQFKYSENKLKKELSL